MSADERQSRSAWRRLWLWISYATMFCAFQLVAAAFISGIRREAVPRATIEGVPIALGILVGAGVLVFLFVHTLRSLKGLPHGKS